MCSSRPNVAPISEPLPCLECGKVEVVYVIEDCRMLDGLFVPGLRHLKCGACGHRLFDDDAMHVVQAERAKRHSPTN